MINANLARGVFCMALALFFGFNALRYPTGSLAHAGPGLFPLMVSGMLLVLSIIAIAGSRLVEAVPLVFQVRNIGLVLLSLLLFVAASRFVDMLLGIVLLVFVSGLAATSYSWKRNVQISIGLACIAFAIEKFLGLQLGLL